MRVDESSPEFKQGYQDYMDKKERQVFKTKKANFQYNQGWETAMFWTIANSCGMYDG